MLGVNHILLNGLFSILVFLSIKLERTLLPVPEVSQNCPESVIPLTVANLIAPEKVSERSNSNAEVAKYVVPHPKFQLFYR